jgi:hypothetical protein
LVHKTHALKNDVLKKEVGMWSCARPKWICALAGLHAAGLCVGGMCERRREQPNLLTFQPT